MSSSIVRQTISDIVIKFANVSQKINFCNTKCWADLPSHLPDKFLQIHNKKCTQFQQMFLENWLFRFFFSIFYFVMYGRKALCIIRKKKYDLWVSWSQQKYSRPPFICCNINWTFFAESKQYTNFLYDRCYLVSVFRWRINVISTSWSYFSTLEKCHFFFWAYFSFPCHILQVKLKWIMSHKPSGLIPNPYACWLFLNISLW